MIKAIDEFLSATFEMLGMAIRLAAFAIFIGAVLWQLTMFGMIPPTTFVKYVRFFLVIGEWVADAIDWLAVGFR